MQRIAVLASWLFLFSCGIWGDVCGPFAASSLIDRVYDYVRYEAPGLSSEQRAFVVSRGLVRAVQDWPFLDRLQDYQFFAFPRGASFFEGGVLVAIDDGQQIYPIRGVEDLNELLQRQGTVIGSKEDAEALSELVLRALHVRNVFYCGYERGVRVIHTVDDIEHVSLEDRRALDRAGPPVGPKIVESDGVFGYSVFSWQRDGSGAVERHIIAVGRHGILKYDVKLLRNRVGAWVGER